MFQLDPVVNNIRSITDCSSLDDIKEFYVGDSSGTYFVKKGTAICQVVSWLRWTVSIFRKTHRERCDKSVLAFTKERFVRFEKYLLGETLISTQKYLLGLSFSTEWKGRFQKAHRLFGLEGHFPSLRRAQRTVAAHMVRDASATSIPWKVLDAILRKSHQDPKNFTIETLPVASRKILIRWSEDLKRMWAFLSPHLIFRLCEAAVLKTFPDLHEEEVVSRASNLIYLLSQSGVAEVLEADEGQFDQEIQVEKISSKVGEQLVPEFALGDEFRVYEYTPSPFDRCTLLSSSNLIMRTWFYAERHSPRVIPCAKCFSWNAEKKIAVLEKLEGTLKNKIWDDTAKDTPLVEELSNVVRENLFHAQSTPELKLGRIFLTPNKKLRTVKPLKETQGPIPLHIIEEFIVNVCRKNRSRISDIFERSDFFSHSDAIFFRNIVVRQGEKLFKNAYKTAIENEARESCIQSPQVILRAHSHIEELREHFAHIEGQVRFITKEARYLRKNCNRWILEALLVLQKKIGFLTLLPDTIDEEITGWIHKHKLTPMVGKAETFSG